MSKKKTRQDITSAPEMRLIEPDETPEMVLCYDPHEGIVIRPKKRPVKEVKDGIK